MQNSNITPNSFNDFTNLMQRELSQCDLGRTYSLALKKGEELQQLTLSEIASRDDAQEIINRITTVSDLRNADLRETIDKLAEESKGLFDSALGDAYQQYLKKGERKEVLQLPEEDVEKSSSGIFKDRLKEYINHPSDKKALRHLSDSFVYHLPESVAADLISTTENYMEKKRKK